MTPEYAVHHWFMWVKPKTFNIAAQIR